MASNWESLLFETTEAGVSSAVVPELLPANQIAWALNTAGRGGKMQTRPNFARRLTLPAGLIQGAGYFSVQGGMSVTQIAGVLYRLRIGTNLDFAAEEISLPWDNSPVIRQVWMQQAVESLVIQDGQSDAVIYDGSSAQRAAPGQVPRGRQMAYGNGRLWVAINANNLVAGDIRTNTPGSELGFTETNYLSGGGALYFPQGIVGLAFIPVTGQADYGALLVFGTDYTNAVRADVTSRDDWAKTPGFVTTILWSVGTASAWSVVAVNQDLYWRDSNGGIRSIRNALADETGPGNAPVSREVSRLADFDSQQLLGFCSAVYHDNRLLMTSSPYLLGNLGVGWKNLMALDFAPLSTMRGKAQPAYDGQWSGVNFVKLVAGKFGGRDRAFALVTSDEGENQLWEFGTGARADLPVGQDNVSPVQYPITCFSEYPLRDFGAPKHRKRLARCDVWLSGVNGRLELSVYWRPDNAQQWMQWDDDLTCAKTTDAATNAPHVWKNLLPQERPQFKTFTIPENLIEMVGYAAEVGFEFQIRLVWRGKCRIHRVMVHGTVLDDPDYANRETFVATCIENDVTDNVVTYRIPNIIYANRIIANGALRRTAGDERRVVVL